MIRIREGAHGELFALRSESADVRETVAKIIADVKERGDAALLEYTRRFDGASLTALEVTQEERERALTAVPTRGGEYSGLPQPAEARRL
jgi:histidinol dehydrogenase